jgi:trehalose 6-phosphate phosphatase
VTAATAKLIDSVCADFSGTLVALDFDGTLAPIVADPATSRPADGAVAAMHALAERGAHLAVVTGRDAETVLALGGFETVPGLVVEGLYGADEWVGGQLTTQPTPEAMTRLASELPAILAQPGADPNLWIENKRLSLVLHARMATDPQAALDQLLDPASELAVRLGLELHPGRGVLEFRLPRFDKARALRRLVTRWSPRTVVYAGDDLGDLPAFELLADLRQRGLETWAVLAASDETPGLGAQPDATVAGPAGMVELLAALAAAAPARLGTATTRRATDRARSAGRPDTAT